MKWVLGTVIVVVIAVGLALLADQDPGYVLIGYGQWTIELSLILLVLLLILAFALLHYTLVLLGALRRTSSRLGHWRRHRRETRAQKALSRGLVSLAEGHWQRAEKVFARNAEAAPNALIHYLGAAHAAQRQGADARRDQYLELAHRQMPEADVAIGLTQAELQMSQHQLEQALATLSHLRRIAPSHPHVLKLLARVYEEVGDWAELKALLPELRKRKVLPPNTLDAMQEAVTIRLLERAAGDPDRNALHQAWTDTPRALRDHEPVLAVYLKLLLSRDEMAEAERLIRTRLNQRWSDELVRLYGRIDLGAAHQLQTAEKWLRGRETNPALNLTLGRLAARTGQWEKAQEYLETSLQGERRPETCRELALLMERTGQSVKAQAYFREGLLLATAGDTDPAAIAAPPVFLEGPAVEPAAEPTQGPASPDAAEARPDRR